MSSTATSAMPLPPLSSVQIPAARPAKPGFSLGKYREVVIAVALFLIFDLGVLVLNFYISFQISEDATAINLAGRQRMLSQRTTKAIYAVEDQIAQTGRAGDDGQELRAALDLFDNSLRAFRQGGTVTGGDGQTVQLSAVTSAKAQAAIAQSQAIWSPLLDKANALLQTNPSPEQVREAVSYARANNTALLARMNDLTTALEQEAFERASRLRWVQTVGIVLALLNFVFILFKFIRSLRRADDAAEMVARENREILASVREGLFLITPQLQVGTQIAKSSHELFGRPVHAGETFTDLLKPLVSNKILQDAQDYLNLLFEPHVKEQLVQSINPLSDVQVYVTNRLGKSVLRHLSFAFNRAIDNNAVTHLLVTVQDITARKELEAALQAHKQVAQKEISLMLKALETDSATLAEFVSRAEQDMLEVNRQLGALSASGSGRETQQVIDAVFRRIHAFKGEAQTLGLEVLSTQAHAMETQLQSLRGSETPSQEHLLQLPIHLEDLLSKLGVLRDIATRQRTSIERTDAPADQNTSLAQHPIDFSTQLNMLAKDMARDLGKSVELSAQCPVLTSLPQMMQQSLKDITIQLVRNAIAHGIEVPSQRLALHKTVAGHIDIQLSQEAGAYTLSVRDDGAGISAARIKEHLAQQGAYSPEQLAAMDDKQAIAHIFKPGFSTAPASDVSSLHAGRGVGLDVVQTQAKSMDAQLSLSTTPGQYTQWRLRFKGSKP